MYDGSQQTGIYYRTLGPDGAPSSEVVRLFDTFDADYEFVGEIDDTFYVRTTADAPNCAADRRAGDVGRAQELARRDSGEPSSR